MNELGDNFLREILLQKISISNGFSLFSIWFSRLCIFNHFVVGWLVSSSENHKALVAIIPVNDAVSGNQCGTEINESFVPFEWKFFPIEYLLIAKIIESIYLLASCYDSEYSPLFLWPNNGIVFHSKVREKKATKKNVNEVFVKYFLLCIFASILDWARLLTLLTKRRIHNLLVRDYLNVIHSTEYSERC